MLADMDHKQELVDKLQKYDFKTPILEKLSIRELEELLRAVESMAPTQTRRKRARDPKMPDFSSADKKILKALLSSSGTISSLKLSKQLEIPLSTVQRRRKKMESDFLELYYLPRIEKLGWHAALIFISMDSGIAVSAAWKLLSWEDSVVNVTRTMGDEKIDLVVQVTFRDNKDLLEICDRIKAISGVKSIFWTELVERIGKNTTCFESMIDNM